MYFRPTSPAHIPGHKKNKPDPVLGQKDSDGLHNGLFNTQPDYMKPIQNQNKKSVSLQSSKIKQKDSFKFLKSNSIQHAESKPVTWQNIDKLQTYFSSV